MRKICLISLLFLLQSAYAFTIVGSGQSNMCGRGVDGPSPLTADSHVKVWNNTNELVSDGNAFIVVPDFGNPPWHLGGGNNLALWFADAAARELNTDVNLMVVCKGGQSISQWQEGQEMYEALVRNYRASGLPAADVFLWHQGEADKNMAPCTYRLRLLNLISRLRNEGVLAYGAPTIVGELRYAAAATINTALEDTAIYNPDVRYVHADGLADFDGTHFTGPSLRNLGLRYWDAYSQ